MSKGQLLPTSTIAASEHQISTKAHNSTVLLNVASGIYYTLNEAGSLVWDQVQMPVTVEAVCDAVQKKYRIDADRCERDVLSLIKDLDRVGLISITP